jgi:hypothetical protein
MSLREAEVSRSRRAQRTHQKQTKKTKKQFQRRKQQIAEMRKRRLDALPAVLNDNQCLTFREWCAFGHFSERTGRRILNSGTGPVVTQLSPMRIGITVANDRAWKASRERV